MGTCWSRGQLTASSGCLVSDCAHGNPGPLVHQPREESWVFASWTRGYCETPVQDSPKRIGQRLLQDPPNYPGPDLSQWTWEGLELSSPSVLSS